jgi:hypothetical protein
MLLRSDIDAGLLRRLGEYSRRLMRLVASGELESADLVLQQAQTGDPVLEATCKVVGAHADLISGLLRQENTENVDKDCVYSDDVVDVNYEAHEIVTRGERRVIVVMLGLYLSSEAHEHEHLVMVEWSHGEQAWVLAELEGVAPAEDGMIPSVLDQTDLSLDLSMQSVIAALTTA